MGELLVIKCEMLNYKLQFINKNLSSCEKLMTDAIKQS